MADGICNAQINAPCSCNGFQFPAQAIADGFHVDAVPVAAHTSPQNRLRQIIADVQPELAPHLFLNVLRNPEVDPGIREQFPHCLDTFTLKRCKSLAIDHTKCCIRVKMVTIRFLVRCNLNEGIQQMLCTYLCGDQLFAVHTVHQTHHNGIVADSGLDAFQSSGQ